MSCKSTYNGHNGFGHGHASIFTTGLVIAFCEIAYSNQSHFSKTWEAGGCKISVTGGATVFGNYVHHNRGAGLWSDVSVTETHWFRNIVILNERMGINSEISFGDCIAWNYCRDNGNEGQNESWDRNANIYIQNSGFCWVHNNISVQTSAYDYGDGLTFVNQDRGFEPSLIPSASFIDGDEHLCRYNRAYGNIFYRDISGDDERVLLELQSDHQDSEFVNNLIDYNEYHQLSGSTDTVYTVEWWNGASVSTASGDRLSDISSSPYEGNGSETLHASSATFPDWTDPEGNSWGWDETPDWFDITGMNWWQLDYDMRLKYIPALFRAYDLDETSGTVINDRSFWEKTDGEYINTPTLNDTGIGDGKGAVTFEASGTEYAELYDSDYETLWHNPDGQTYMIWAKNNGTYETNDKYIWGMGSSDGAPNSLSLLKGRTDGDMDQQWSHNGVNDNPVHTYTPDSNFHLWVGRYSTQQGQATRSKDGTIWDTDTAKLTLNRWVAQSFGSPRVRLNSRVSGMTPANLGDHTLSKFYLWNTALSDYIVEKILYEFNSSPVVSDIEDQTDTIGNAISTLSVVASDLDTLTYTADGLPTGLSINSGTGAITGTPSATGTFNVEIQVTDDGSPNRVSYAWFDWVIETNESPVWDAQGTVNLTEDLVMELVVLNVTDPDSLSMVFIASGLPTGVSSVQTGVKELTLYGTPTATGTFNVSVSADDGYNTPVDLDFDIVVSPAPVSTPTGVANRYAENRAKNAGVGGGESIG